MLNDYGKKLCCIVFNAGCLCVYVLSYGRTEDVFFWVWNFSIRWLFKINVIQNTLDSGLLLHSPLTIHWVKANTKNELQMLFALNLILVIPFLKLKFYKIPKLCCFKQQKSRQTLFVLSNLFHYYTRDKLAVDFLHLYSFHVCVI